MRMRMGLHKGEQGMQVQFRVSEHLAFCIPFLGGFSLNLFFFALDWLVGMKLALFVWIFYR